MSTCRENVSLFLWLRHYGIKRIIKRRIWKDRNFMQDTFFTGFNRFLGCKIFGHRKVEIIKDEEGKEPDRKFCFNCYRDIK
jgi:hypothetical protein